MIVIGVIFSVILAWIMAKGNYEQKKHEMRLEMAWRLLALAAVKELAKQKKKQEGEADDSDDRASD